MSAPLFSKPRTGKLHPARKCNVAKQRAADKAEREQAAAGLRAVEWKRAMREEGARR